MKIFKILTALLITLGITSYSGYYYYNYLDFPKNIIIISSSNIPPRVRADDVISSNTGLEEGTVFRRIFNKDSKSQIVKIGKEPEKPIEIPKNVEKKNKENTIQDNIEVNFNKDNAHKFTYDSKKDEVYQLIIAVTLTKNVADENVEIIKKRFSSIINNKKCFSKKVIAAEKVFYQIMIGDFRSFNEAKALCKKLKDNDQECIIIKTRS